MLSKLFKELNIKKPTIGIIVPKVKNCMTSVKVTDLIPPREEYNVIIQPAIIKPYLLDIPNIQKLYQQP